MTQEKLDNINEDINILFDELWYVCADDPKLKYSTVHIPEERKAYTKEDILTALCAYYRVKHAVKTIEGFHKDALFLAEDVYNKWERSYINKEFILPAADYRWLRKHFNTAAKLALI